MDTHCKKIDRREVRDKMSAKNEDRYTEYYLLASMSGPFMIPPPIPNIPAQNPASVLIRGYIIVLEESHFTSSSRKT